MDGNRKRQAYIHTAGIGANRLVNIFTDIGKSENVIEFFIGLLPAQTENSGIHIEIISPGKFRIKSSTKLQERSDFSVNVNPAFGGIYNATNALQKRRLATTIAIDNANSFFSNR